jgi:hypothetical protein
MPTQLELFPEGADFSLRSPSEYIYEGLRSHFKMSCNDRMMACYGFVDGLMSAAIGHPVINVIKLDKYLITTHYPEYTGENMSMSEAICKFYGAEADNWLAKHLY